MPREIPELEAYNQAIAAFTPILAEAERLAALVMNGAKMLQSNPAHWRFAEPAAEWDRDDDRLPIDEPPIVPISPTGWPSIGTLIDLKQKYERAVADEGAAFSALPAALKPLVARQKR